MFTRLQFVLLCGLLAAASTSADASTSVCALAPEGKPATLTCPPGTVIDSITSATFGEFASNSSCTSLPLKPTARCPTTVMAQAALLCRKRVSCSVQCGCDAEATPPCACALVGAAAATVGGALAVPAWPCDGVPKALWLTATCAAAACVDEPAASSGGEGEGQQLELAAGLMLEFMPSPVQGLDNLKPHFSWASKGPAKQVAFRVNVSSCGASGCEGPAGPLLWSSGTVKSASPLLAVSAAHPLPLASDSQYAWTVETTGAAGAPAVVGEAAFSTGLLALSDWAGAEWIDAGACPEAAGTWKKGAHWLPTASCQGGLLRKVHKDPCCNFLCKSLLLTPRGLLRKDFEVSEAAERVSVFVSGCHYYELYLDGKRVGSDAGITNSWTRFNRFRSYATMGVDPSLLPVGKHTLGLHVGQGFCGEPEQGVGAPGVKNISGTRAALLKVALHSAGGKAVQTVVTDASWQLGQSPLGWESSYYGETYLSGLEQRGWAAPAFKPGKGFTWAATKVVKYSPPPKLSSQLQPPIRAVHLKPAVSVQRVLKRGYTKYSGDAALATPARWTFDFGQVNHAQMLE